LGSIAASGFANTSLQIVFAWLVLLQTGDAFLVAAVFAAQQLPRLILGLPAGAVASSPSRTTWMVICAASSALVVTGVAAGALPRTVPVLLVVSFVIGSVDTVRLVLTQTAIYDVGGSSNSTSNLAMSNLSVTLSRGAGGVIGATAINSLGVSGALFIVSSGYAIAGLWLLTFQDSAPAGRARIASVSLVLRQALAVARLAGATPTLRDLALAAISAEVFAFSIVAVLPVLTLDVLGSGASGLGLLLGGKAVGSAVGLVVLAQVGSRPGLPRGLIFAGMLTSFGVLVGLLGMTQLFVVALALLVGIGVTSGLVDTLVQTLMQSTSIEAGHRAGLGISVWAVGFGPIGQLEVGLVAMTLGVQTALIANGVALAVASVALAPRIARLR
jgi:hypothetical protein